jgi:glutamyl-tRNA synthetase
MKERVKRLNHFADMTGYFFNDFDSYNEKAIKKRFKKGEPTKVLETAKTDFENLESFEIPNIEKLLHDITEKLELSMGGVNPVIRLAVTGEGGGPDLAYIIELLGKEKTINRIEKAIKWIKENV